MGYIVPLMTWQPKLKSKRLKNGVIRIGLIDEAASNVISSPHGKVLLECYIDPKILSKMASDNSQKPGDILRDQILPDRASIKSGDFGEILARSVIQERKDNPQFPAHRWRDRENKNATITGPDLIGYVIGSKNLSKNDLLILCEVKTRAITISDKVVEEAYKGARKHYASKLANSLLFLQKHLNSLGRYEEAKNYARFKDPYKNNYQRQIVPCVVHESSTWDEKFLELLPEKYDPVGEYKIGEKIEVLIICVENLSDFIDRVYSEAINCAGQ